MSQSKSPQSLKVERAIMVYVNIFDSPKLLSLENSLSELRRLADTAGFEVVGQVTQKLDHPNPRTFIGSGKVKEVKSIANELDERAVEDFRPFCRLEKGQASYMAGQFGCFHREKDGVLGAELLHREALSIQRTVLGAEHPHVATTLVNLASVLQMKGDRDRAEQFPAAAP